MMAGKRKPLRKRPPTLSPGVRFARKRRLRVVRLRWLAQQMAAGEALDRVMSDHLEDRRGAEVTETYAHLRQRFEQGKLDGLWNPSAWAARESPSDEVYERRLQIALRIAKAKEQEARTAAFTTAEKERKAEEKERKAAEKEEEARWEADYLRREADQRAELRNRDRLRLHRAWTEIRNVFLEITPGVVGYVVGVPPRIVDRSDPADDEYQDGVEAKFRAAGFAWGEVVALIPRRFKGLYREWASLAQEIAEQAGSKLLIHDYKTYAATVFGPKQAPYAGFFRVAVMEKIERGKHLSEDES